MELPIDLSEEIRFRTARSSGKGGQHVNKVETQVDGLFDIDASPSLTREQKALLFDRLAPQINRSGLLVVRCQKTRSQLANKEQVIEKINKIVAAALKPRKKRKRTKPTKASREKRLKKKEIQSEKKERRKEDRTR